MQGEVTVHMNAPVDKVLDLVTDATRIGEFSPETFDAEWIKGATGPAVGAWFRGHVKRNQKGPTYWTKCEVVASEPGREFAFNVLTGGRATNTWRYVIQPADDGCDVTESFQLADLRSLRLYWTLFGWTRGKTNRNGMRTTLERIKAEVERPAS